MSNPMTMPTGRATTDDLDNFVGTDTDMRLRLRFEHRELVVDECPSSITIGRADENDVVVQSHLSSRLHARIVIGRSNFVLIDQSTNGTFVRTSDGEEFFVRHDILQLHGNGMIGVANPPQQGSQHTIHFTCENESRTSALVTHPQPARRSQQREWRKTDRHNNLPETRQTLQQALRTLSGIRTRHEKERATHPDTRFHRVHVVLDDSDMHWIDATIQALEKPAATDVTEATGRIARGSFGKVN